MQLNALLNSGDLGLDTSMPLEDTLDTSFASVESNNAIQATLVPENPPAPLLAAPPACPPLPLASRDDDLLSDVLVDNILFRQSQGRRSRKINNDYELMPVNIDKMMEIVHTMKTRTSKKNSSKRRGIQRKALQKAVQLFQEMPLYTRYTEGLSPKQKSLFDSHLVRYLSIFYYDVGFEICETVRYADPKEEQEKLNAALEAHQAAIKAAPPLANGSAQTESVSDNCPLWGAPSASIVSTATSPSALDGTPSETGEDLLKPPTELKNDAPLERRDETLLCPPSNLELVSSAPSTPRFQTNPSSSSCPVIQEPLVEELLWPTGPDYRTLPVLDLAIRATKKFATGDIVPFLSGSLADLTSQQDDELRKDRNGLQSDFSVMMNPIRKCFQLFLGPARFCNHDCDPNVQMMRQGKSIVFKAIKDIHPGDELCSFYGQDYFDDKNASCKCWTCEKTGSGAFKGKKNIPHPEEGDASRAALLAIRKAKKKARDLSKPTHLIAPNRWYYPPAESEDGSSSESEEESDEETDEEPVVSVNLIRQRRGEGSGSSQWFSFLPPGVEINWWKPIEVDVQEPRMTRTGKRSRGGDSQKREAEAEAPGTGETRSVRSLADIQKYLQYHTIAEWNQSKEMQETILKAAQINPEEYAQTSRPKRPMPPRKPQKAAQPRKRKAELEDGADYQDPPREKKPRIRKPKIKPEGDVVSFLHRSTRIEQYKTQKPRKVPIGGIKEFYDLKWEYDYYAYSAKLGREVQVKGFATAAQEVAEQEAQAEQGLPVALPFHPDAEEWRMLTAPKTNGRTAGKSPTKTQKASKASAKKVKPQDEATAPLGDMAASVQEDDTLSLADSSKTPHRKLRAPGEETEEADFGDMALPASSQPPLEPGSDAQVPATTKQKKAPRKEETSGNQKSYGGKRREKILGRAAAERPRKRARPHTHTFPAPEGSDPAGVAVPALPDQGLNNAKGPGGPDVGPAMDNHPADFGDPLTAL